MRALIPHVYNSGLNFPIFILFLFFFPFSFPFLFFLFSVDKQEISKCKCGKILFI